MIHDDLIARLEAAPEGSRELDEAIATHLWGEPKPSGNVGSPRTLVWWHYGVGRSVAPEFTESLDTALTLGPDGMNCWGLDCDPLGNEAYVSRNNVSDGHWHFEGQHKHSSILALCIAALKARQAARDAV